MRETKKNDRIRKDSPHISRNISAVMSFLGSLLLWTALGGLLSVNVLAFFSGDRNQASVSDILMYPGIPAPHITLANLLWQNGKVDLAKRELAVASALQSTSEPGSSVLGETSEDLLSLWEKQNEDLNREYEYWQTVIGKKPDYRDAYITLISIAVELGKYEDARFYYGAVKKLDPNVTLVSSLKSAMELE